MSSSSSSSESLVLRWRILCPTNPNEELSPTPAPHAVQEAKRMGDVGDVGVGRVGDKGVKGVIGVKRVNDDVGDNDDNDANDKGDDDKDKGDDDKGDDDNDDNGDENDENDAVGKEEAGVGRGRIRRALALCVEDAVLGGTAGKARLGARCGSVAFFIDEAPGNVLFLSILAAA